MKSELPAGQSPSRGVTNRASIERDSMGEMEPLDPLATTRYLASMPPDVMDTGKTECPRVNITRQMQLCTTNVEMESLASCDAPGLATLAAITAAVHVQSPSCPSRFGGIGALQDKLLDDMLEELANDDSCPYLRKLSIPTLMDPRRPWGGADEATTPLTSTGQQQALVEPSSVPPPPQDTPIVMAAAASRDGPLLMPLPLYHQQQPQARCRMTRCTETLADAVVLLTVDESMSSAAAAAAAGGITTGGGGDETAPPVKAARCSGGGGSFMLLSAGFDDRCAQQWQGQQAEKQQGETNTRSSRAAVGCVEDPGPHPGSRVAAATAMSAHLTAARQPCGAATTASSPVCVTKEEPRPVWLAKGFQRLKAIMRS